jgi:hypothetical protein
MTKSEAEHIKNEIEKLNKFYFPMTLHFDMYRNPKEDHDDNWFVTIIYHVVPEEWMTFTSLGFNYSVVLDKLSGWQFALEAVKAHQDEHGNLNLAQ